MSARRRNGMARDGSPSIRQLWRVVDGAVASAFDAHPDYLTGKGRSLARTSIVKRVVGQVHSYAVTAATISAVRAAGGRSGSSPAADEATGANPPPPGCAMRFGAPTGTGPSHGPVSPLPSMGDREASGMRDFIERGGFVSPIHRRLVLEVLDDLTDGRLLGLQGTLDGQVGPGRSEVHAGDGNGRGRAGQEVSVILLGEP